MGLVNEQKRLARLQMIGVTFLLFFVSTMSVITLVGVF